MELQNLTNSINNIEATYSNLENEKNKLDIEISLLKDLILQNENELKILKEDIINCEKSKTIINDIILKTRNEAIKFIENVVNCALLDVFQNPNLKLKLQLNTEGAKTSISTFIEENGQLYDIESGRGGGLRDLVSTAILICCRTLVKPKIELPLLLDESFKFLHSTKDNKFKKNAFKFLQDVANKLDIQIILITGEEDKDAIEAADNIIFISKKNNESFLEKI